MRHLLPCLLPFLFLLFPSSCEKELEDYRDVFTGEFLFTTVRHSWVYGIPMQYDTSTFTFEGEVRINHAGDDNADLYSDPDSLNPDSTLFIEFLDGQAVLTEISEEGVFVPRGGYHYYCTGSFLNTDELVFSVGGLGGLGGGYSYAVSGIRIPVGDK